MEFYKIHICDQCEGLITAKRQESLAPSWRPSGLPFILTLLLRGLFPTPGLWEMWLEIADLPVLELTAVWIS